MGRDAIVESVRQFILAELAPNKQPESLGERTSLFSTGMLDSLASLKLIAFLEQHFAIQVEPHEVVAENLDSLKSIAAYVTNKQRDRLSVEGPIAQGG
jgi:acyl carrier protein